MSLPKTSQEILRYIQERCEEGSEIVINKRFRTIDGQMLWCIKGAGVDASGYKSLTEAFIQWESAVQYLQEERKNR